MKLPPAALAVLAGAGVALVVGVVLYRYREKFNPVSRDNLAYQGAGRVVSVLTDNREESVGGVLASVREWWSGDDAAIEAMKAGAPARQAVKAPLPPPSYDDEWSVSP